jgi:hypothetical protein
VLNMKADENIKSGNLHVPATETCVEGASDIVVVDDDDDDKQIVSGEAGSENLLSGAEDNEIDSIKGFCVEKCSSVSLDSATKRKGGENECCEPDISLDSTQNGAGEGDEGSSAETLKSISKSKRHCDRDLDNPNHASLVNRLKIAQFCPTSTVITHFVALRIIYQMVFMMQGVTGPSCH